MAEAIEESAERTQYVLQYMLYHRYRIISVIFALFLHFILVNLILSN